MISSLLLSTLLGFDGSGMSYLLNYFWWSSVPLLFILFLFSYSCFCFPLSSLTKLFLICAFSTIFISPLVIWLIIDNKMDWSFPPRSILNCSPKLFLLIANSRFIYFLNTLSVYLNLKLSKNYCIRSMQREAGIMFQLLSG